MHRITLAASATALMFLLGLALLLPGCATPRGSTEAQIRAVLDRQRDDWNAGSIRDFMTGYARSDTTRFASGGEVRLGWETVLARYTTRYTNRAAMGRLEFTEVQVSPLSRDAALVFGHWRLRREQDEPAGLFTLLFRRTPEGWRIVHDHTSSATP